MSFFHAFNESLTDVLYFYKYYCFSVQILYFVPRLVLCTFFYKPPVVNIINTALVGHGPNTCLTCGLAAFIVHVIMTLLFFRFYEFYLFSSKLMQIILASS